MKALFFSLTLEFLSITGQANAEVIVNDVLDHQVRLEKPAERVVLGFYYEDFLAVVGPNALDKVIALSLAPWKDWRPNQYALYEAALPKLHSISDVGATDNGDFSVEKVVAARPDLVILPAWANKALGTSVKQIEDAGIPVVTIDYNAQTLEKHIQSTEVLGKVMGAETRAHQLIENYKAAMADIDARVKRATPTQKKVYIEVGSKGASSIGNSYSGDMWGGLVNRLGGQNIAKGELKGLGPLNPEFVLAQKPDVILIAGSEWQKKPEAMTMGFSIDESMARQRLAPYMARAGWSELPAVKNGDVYAIYHGGARTLSDYVYAQYIAKQLYPEEFKDLDPAQELRDYYAKWLPIKADGLFMMRYGKSTQ
ncbi:ABC transporter substrate-binding protein [Rhizobium sp.]|uniref:ABC transporter substrate-binding protein n=1 Tax=Rhizobium sp. TaxID=391 RepID=UPI000E935511|nr:iron ABC transporter substrate-binding protein [Rhizobium sp.]